MSQKVRIMSAKVTGKVYLGPVTDPETGLVQHRWSNSPEEVIGWLWDVYRSRFNQRRSLRRKYVYAPAPDGRVIEHGRHKGCPVMVRQEDADGQPLLAPIGRDDGVDERKSAFRVSHPFAAAAPDLLLQHADRSESTDWFAAAKRRKKRGGAMPWFRSRKHEATRFAVFTGGPARGHQQCGYRQTGRKSGVVTITGMNPAGMVAAGHGRRWKITFRVRASQRIRPYTSVMFDWTNKSLVFVSPPPALSRTPTGEQVGIDVGIAHTIATSDGRFFDQPDTTDVAAQIRHRQRRLARKKRLAGYANKRGYTPSKRYTHERQMLARAHQHRTNILDNWRHQTTTALVRDYDLIAYEALNVKAMTTSAKGTTTHPGTNVAAKTALNRSLARSAFATLRHMIEYKAEHANVATIPVDPRNTSRTCSHCNHTAKENRESQALFSCVRCGHTANADTNAAENILARATNHTPETPQAGPGHAPAGDIADKTDPTTVDRPLGASGATSLKTTHTNVGIPAL